VDLEKWYLENKSKYEILLDRVKNLLSILLDREKITYYQIQSRIKCFEKFEAKMNFRKYARPEEMNDFGAVRIICYLISERQIISGLMEDNFRILKSDDKSTKLDVDRFGYTAIHLDAMLKENRIYLPEYEQFSGLKFEIQITTILQHAWAQIEHDRNYKGGTVLPENLQREFYRISAILDDCDSKFESITKEIEEYNENVRTKVHKNQLDIPIDSSSLRRYLFNKFGDIPDFKPKYGFMRERRVIDQLGAMGIKTLAEFEKIIPSNFKERYLKLPKSKYGTYATGIVLWILIIHNYWNISKKYMKRAMGCLIAMTHLYSRSLV
jgi:putative GTP pyrophosphokinase